MTVRNLTVKVKYSKEIGVFRAACPFFIIMIESAIECGTTGMGVEDLDWRFSAWIIIALVFVLFAIWMKKH